MLPCDSGTHSHAKPWQPQISSLYSFFFSECHRDVTVGCTSLSHHAMMGSVSDFWIVGTWEDFHTCNKTSWNEAKSKHEVCLNTQPGSHSIKHVECPCTSALTCHTGSDIEFSVCNIQHVSAQIFRRGKVTVGPFETGWCHVGECTWGSGLLSRSGSLLLMSLRHSPQCRGTTVYPLTPGRIVVSFHLGKLWSVAINIWEQAFMLM